LHHYARTQMRRGRAESRSKVEPVLRHFDNVPLRPR
jgi:hypothetical protein